MALLPAICDPAQSIYDIRTVLAPTAVETIGVCGGGEPMSKSINSGLSLALSRPWTDVLDHR